MKNRYTIVLPPEMSEKFVKIPPPVIRNAVSKYLFHLEPDCEEILLEYFNTLWDERNEIVLKLKEVADTICQQAFNTKFDGNKDKFKELLDNPQKHETLIPHIDAFKLFERKKRNLELEIGKIRQKIKWTPYT